MIDDHYEAVKARLEDDHRLVGKVFDTTRQNEKGELVRANYVVLYGGSPAELGGDRATRAQVPNDNGVFDYVARCVGVSPSAVRELQGAVSGQLTNWVPFIPDRYCRPVKYTGGDRWPRTDDSVKPPLFYADDEYELRSFFRNGGS